MIPIDEMTIRSSLARDNPWWSNPDWEPLEKEHQRSYLKPFCDLAINLNVRRSTVLMGPRRVGKTVLLMQLIHHVLTDQNTAIAPSRIFFTSLDTPLYSNMSLEQLIGLFEKETGCGSDEQRLIIFDEIQYLKDWERHLKVLTDRHPNSKFIASGSAAAALRLKSNESGAGRFTNFLLPPLTFAEFLEFTNQAPKGSPVENTPVDVLLLASQNGATIESVQVDAAVARLNEEFINYINYGGYPEAVLNSEIRENSSQFIGRDIIDKVLLRDLPSIYGINNPQELNRLFTTIAWNTGQEMSLENLSKDSGASKQTIIRYLEYLEAAMLIKRVRRIDNNAKLFKRERQFKVYLTNPSLRTALFGPITQENTNQLGYLVETALFSQCFHSSVSEHLYYARWKKGQKTHEVDMVFVNPTDHKPHIAAEVKWSDELIERPEKLSGLLIYGKMHSSLKEKGSIIATTRTRIDSVTRDGVTIQFGPSAFWSLAWGRQMLNPNFNINQLNDLLLQPT